MHSISFQSSDLRPIAVYLLSKEHCCTFMTFYICLIKVPLHCFIKLKARALWLILNYFFSMNFKIVHNINLEIPVKILTQYLILTKSLTHFVHTKDCMISFYSAHCSRVGGRQKCWGGQYYYTFRGLSVIQAPTILILENFGGPWPPWPPLFRRPCLLNV